MEPASDGKMRRVSALAGEMLRDMPTSSEAAVMRAAESVEEALFGGDGSERPYSEVVGELPALDRLQERYGPRVLKVPPRLGVCPAVVFRALSLLRSDRASFGDIEKITACDPVLATSLLSHANSVLYARMEPVSSVAAAIAYIGTDAAKRVVLAASARPLFASVELQGLWQHSVDVAVIAEQLAATAGMRDPAEAFVAGLIHDVGRLAVELAAADDFVIAHTRLAQASGCVVLADVALTGQDHGGIGATVLGGWRLPEALLEAIRYHHQPHLSGSVMASILYLAEEVSRSGEAVVAAPRLEGAMRRAGTKDLEWVSSDPRRLGTALAMAG